MFKGKIRRYMNETFNEVLQTTFNPNGPGAVRIHLLPPKADGGLNSSLVIVNGRDILPLSPVWTVMLAEFIKEVNKYDGEIIEDEDLDLIYEQSYKRVSEVVPFLSKKQFSNDIGRIVKTFKKLATGEVPDEDVQYISIGDYADYMRAPHRMDLLVSAMVKDGRWHCNQKCIHCYAADQQLAEEKELNTDDWKKILDKLRKIAVPQVTFTGGEPTIRDDLIELIAYARWFVTRLNTNGIKLDEEYCRRLKDAELDGLQITFYSADKAIHNKLVGADQYDRTLAGIKNALAAGLNPSINTPLCSLNSDYVATLRFLKDLGVTYVTCSGLITTGKALKSESSSLQLSPLQIKEVLQAAVAFAYENAMEINFTSPGWIEESVFDELAIAKPNCGACLSNMAITPGGNVVPCQSWLSDNVLGNILTDEWDVIWNSPICVRRRDYSSLMLGSCPLRKDWGGI